MIDKIEEFALNILERIKLQKLANLYREHREGMRYLIFGGLTTLVNIVVYIIFAKVILASIQDMNLVVNLSEIIAFILSVAFAYITNKLYVFDSKTENAKQLLREIVSFVSCRIFTEIISIVMMNMSVWFSINDVLMKVVSNIVVIILNFVFSKIIIFKNTSKK